MEATDKKPNEPQKSEHGTISLPENMERSPQKAGNTPQRTAGTHTPGKSGKKDMSEASERKARRDAILEERKADEREQKQ